MTEPLVFLPLAGQRPHVGIPAGWCIAAQDVSEDDYAYYRWLRRLWSGWAERKPRTLLVVEHDICVPPGLLEEMAACPHTLCAARYDLYAPFGIPPAAACRNVGGPAEGDWADLACLGCSKFGAERPAWPLPDPLPWWLLDSSLAGALRLLGLRWHLHGRVEHMHRSPRISAITSNSPLAAI